MECKICGRTSINPDANFCDYCGASFRNPQMNNSSEQNYGQFNSSVNPAQQGFNPFGQPSGGDMAQQNFTQQGGNTFQNNGQPSKRDGFFTRMFGLNAYNVDGSEKKMTFGNWVFIYLLMFIPYIGTIALIALMCIWAFGKNTPPTRKNWARATMVFVVAMLILFFVMYGDTIAQIFADPQGYLDSLNSLYSGM